MTNNTICKFAWAGATSTMVNTFRPCCRFPFDENNQYPTTDQVILYGKQAFNNNFLTNLRKDMLEGIERRECEKCYIEERSGAISMRQKGNQEFTANTDTLEFDKLEFLEISIDNLCNLECRMCNSRFSTKLTARDQLLNEYGLDEFSPYKVNYKTIKVMEALDLSDLKMIKLLGGEPLISPNLLQFLDRIPFPQNVDLLIITNATVIPPPNIIERLKEFKSVRFDFSIDGIFEYNNYQRVGSDFDNCHNNAISLSKIFPNEHTIHSVYSSLNIFGLEDSTAWFLKNSPFKNSIDIVSNNILSPFISPKWYADAILESISRSNPNKDYVHHLFENFHDYQESKWHRFLKFVRLTDKLYNTNIQTINPMLKKELDKFEVNVLGT